jgi:uncharacterized membrane protein
MLLYLIKVVDNTWLFGLGAPLILSILARDPGSELGRVLIRRLVWSAIALGFLASAILAFLRLNTGWVIREFYNLGVLAPAVAVLLTFIVFSTLSASSGRAIYFGRLILALVLGAIIWAIYWKLGDKRSLTVFLLASIVCLGLVSFGPLALHKPRGVLMATGTLSLAFLAARSFPNLLLYPFEFGIGLDSVFNMDYLSKVTGYLTGLTLIALLWLSITFLSRQAPPKIYRWFLTLGLLILLSQLILEGAQILAARRLVPRWMFRAVLFSLERENLFFLVQASLWSLLACFLMVRARVTVPVGANPALKRKFRARLRSDFRSGATLITAMALVLVTATALRAINNRGPVIADPDPVQAESDQIILPLEPISDGNLHRRVYTAKDGTPVRFIIIKKSQSAYGVGLDACDICGQSGYYQRGDQVVCKLCDVVMNKSTIGFPGGCNPVPLEFKLSEGTMIIETHNLDAEAHRFK